MFGVLVAVVLFPGSAAAILICGQGLQCYSTTTAAMESPGSVTSGQNVTFIAQVTGTTEGAGTVTFYVDGASVGQPVNLDASNKATLVTATGPGGAPFSAGSHTYYASYSGAFLSNDGSPISIGASSSQNSSGSFDVALQADSTLTSLVSSSGGQSSFGQPVTFSAHVSGTPNSPVAGSVTFVVDGVPAATSSLDGAGNASYVAGSLTAGLHHLVAEYGGYMSSTDTFAASQSVPVLETVAAAQHATSITVNPAPAATLFSQPLNLTAHVAEGSAAVSVGSVTIYVDGVPVATSPVSATGSASYAATSLAPGSHSVYAQYAGYQGENDVYASATSPTATVTVSARPTQAVVTASPNPSTEKQLVGFSVAVTDGLSGAAVTSGTASLTVDGKTFAAQPLDTQGRASFRVGPLSPGSHAVSASFSGTPTELPSTSSVITQNVAQPRGEPVIGASVFFTFRSLRGGATQTLEFEVVDLPAGAHLRVLCGGSGCPIRAFGASIALAPACHGKRCLPHGTHRQGRVNLLSRLAGKRFPPGTRLQLDITKAGWREKRFVFTMRAHRTPKVQVTNPLRGSG